MSFFEFSALRRLVPRLRGRADAPPGIDPQAVRQRVSGFLDRTNILTEDRRDGRSPPPFLRALHAIASRPLGALGPGLPFRTPAPGTGGLVWLRIDSHRGVIDPSTEPLGARLDAQPPALLDALRAGRYRLVLDWSHEGRAFHAGLAALHGDLRDRGIPSTSVLLLTQNTALHADCLHRLPDGMEAVRMLPAHAHAGRYWEMVALGNKGVDRADLNVGFAVGPQERQYRYLCMNYHLRPARAIVCARLRARAEPGWLSFSAHRIRVSHEAAMQNFWRTVRALSPSGEAEVRDLIESGLHLETDTREFKNQNDGVFRMPAEAFAASELYIVTETEMSSPTLTRYTEKTLKAIIAGLPFVVFGNYGTVRTLREIGFDTLDGFVDHGYDEIGDPVARLAAAWAQVERFLARPPGFTRRELNRLEAAAAHNRAVFEGRLPLSCILDPLAGIAAFAENRVGREPAT